jgi:1,4-dihydroxy-2-naphthoyl-CoA hydrolase
MLAFIGKPTNDRQMKSIWFEPVTLNEIKQWSRHILIENMGIEFTAVGDDFLQARMPVDERTIQPLGCLHGGASCVLAETIGSVGAHFCVDPMNRFCVGLEINVNHVKSMKSGFVYGTARPLHLGKSTQIWDIQIRDDKESLVAISRLTMAVLQKQIGPGSLS